MVWGQGEEPGPVLCGGASINCGLIEVLALIGGVSIIGWIARILDAATLTERHVIVWAGLAFIGG